MSSGTWQRNFLDAPFAILCSKNPIGIPSVSESSGGGAVSGLGMYRGMFMMCLPEIPRFSIRWARKPCGVLKPVPDASKGSSSYSCGEDLGVGSTGRREGMSPVM